MPQSTGYSRSPEDVFFETDGRGSEIMTAERPTHPSALGRFSMDTVLLNGEPILDFPEINHEAEPTTVDVTYEDVTDNIDVRVTKGDQKRRRHMHIESPRKAGGLRTHSSGRTHKSKINK
jgi:hypothetical protein